VTSSEPLNVKLVPDEADRKLMRDFVGVFGKAMAAKNSGSVRPIRRSPATS